MASTSINFNLQVFWVWVYLVLWHAVTCEGQYHPVLYTGGAPGYGGMPHYPTGTMIPATYNRPAITQGYGYGYTNSQMRAQVGSEEALENAQKAAMEPLNNVISSLPARADFAPYLPLSFSAFAPVTYGRDASSDVRLPTVRPCSGNTGNCHDQKSATQLAAVSKTEVNKEQHQTLTQQQELQQKQQSDQHTQKQQSPGATNRQLQPTSSPCICPCSYYNWMYSGFPYYDLSQLSFPKQADTQASMYSYYPEKSSAKSARTFWLPWAQPAPTSVQNPFGTPGPYSNPFYNRMYYSRRY